MVGTWMVYTVEEWDRIAGRVAAKSAALFAAILWQIHGATGEVRIQIEPRKVETIRTAAVEVGAGRLGSLRSRREPDWAACSVGAVAAAEEILRGAA